MFAFDIPTEAANEAAACPEAKEKSEGTEIRRTIDGSVMNGRGRATIFFIKTLFIIRAAIMANAKIYPLALFFGFKRNTAAKITHGKP